MNTTPLYIFDLDGTLADIRHRRHFVEFQCGSPVTVNGTAAIYRGPNPKIEGDHWIELPDSNSGLWSYSPSDVKFRKNWDAFHAACVNDTPIDAVIDVLACVRHNESDVWIWSGRMDTVSVETFVWLQNHHIRFNQLKMRPAGDYTPDDQLKESWLKAMSPEDRARLVMVFDDRQRAVDMWRRNGVVCAQVAPGDFRCLPAFVSIPSTVTTFYVVVSYLYLPSSAGSAGGLNHEVEITEIVDGWVTYSWDFNGTPVFHTKLSFPFQYRYHLVLDTPEVPKELRSAS